MIAHGIHGSLSRKIGYLAQCRTHWKYGCARLNERLARCYWSYGLTNGVAERFNRYILEITRALLFNSGINKKYWKYAVVTANYLRNRTTFVKGSDNKTPFELWYGHKPDLAHLRVWGCRVLYHHKSDDKLERCVMEGTFLLYGKSDKQYHVLPREPVIYSW